MSRIRSGSLRTERRRESVDFVSCCPRNKLKPTERGGAMIVSRCDVAMPIGMRAFAAFGGLHARRAPSEVTVARRERGHHARTIGHRNGCARAYWCPARGNANA